MTAKYIGDNKLQEIPEMEMPIFVWMGNKKEDIANRSKHSILMDEYNRQLTACKTCPINGTHSFKEGEVYEEGKDFKLQYQTRNGEGSKWFETEYFPIDNVRDEDKRFVAIPLQEPQESEEMKPRIISAIVKEIQTMSPYMQPDRIKDCAERIYNVMKLDGTIKSNHP